MKGPGERASCLFSTPRGPHPPLRYRPLGDRGGRNLGDNHWEKSDGAFKIQDSSGRDRPYAGLTPEVVENNRLALDTSGISSRGPAVSQFEFVAASLPRQMAA
jgi:hypothetical protein